MRPVTEAELAEAVAAASGALLVRGGGTRTLGHAVGEVLETGGLTGVELYEPGALTLVVRAGTPLAQVERVLAADRQRLAFEVPDLRKLLGREGVSTIGGVVVPGGCRLGPAATRFLVCGLSMARGRWSRTAGA